MKAGSVLGFAAVWRYDFRYSFLVCEMGLTIELQFPCTVPSYFHLIMLNSFFLSHTGEKYPEWGSKELLRFRVETAVKSNLQTMEISGNWLQNTVDFSGFGIKENRLTAQRQVCFPEQCFLIGAACQTAADCTFQTDPCWKLYILLGCPGASQGRSSPSVSPQLLQGTKEDVLAYPYG